jgi:hypothetical protein
MRTQDLQEAVKLAEKNNIDSALSLEMTKKIIEIAREAGADKLPEWIDEISKWAKIEWGEDTVTTFKNNEFHIENFFQGYEAVV